MNGYFVVHMKMQGRQKGCAVAIGRAATHNIRADIARVEECCVAVDIHDGSGRERFWFHVHSPPRKHFAEAKAAEIFELGNTCDFSGGDMSRESMYKPGLPEYPQ